MSTLRALAPAKLNCMTKYPSIPTYHTLNPSDGSLSEPTIPFKGPVLGTEKIDGCNARIIKLPDGSYVLGSRDELLHASGDYLANPAHGLVEALLPLASAEWETVHTHNRGGSALVVFYGELYGGHKLTPASVNYTSHKHVGFRVFDIAVIDDVWDMAHWEIDRIAAWRDADGQQFLPEHCLTEFSDESGIELTPRLLTLDDAEQLPRTVDDAHEWLLEYASTTRVALDADARHRAEGIVLRSPDRSSIAKLRFQNYNRTRQLKEKEATMR